MCLRLGGKVGIRANLVTCQHVPAVGLLFVIGRKTNAPVAQTANLFLWVTPRLKSTCAQTIQCAIIDKSICWYGDINFLGYHSSEDTVMRIDDAKMAGELLDITYTSHTNRQNEKV